MIKIQNVRVRGLYLGEIFFRRSVYNTVRPTEIAKRMLPIIELSSPFSNNGRSIIISTPMRLIIVPLIIFFFGFSWRNIVEPIIRRIGAAEAITGKLMLDVSFSPT